MKNELSSILDRFHLSDSSSETTRHFYDALVKLRDRLPDDGEPACSDIGSVTPTDFKYAKMQTVHQLLVNTVSRQTDSTEKAISLANMVNAAFTAIDSPDMGEVSDGYHTFNELYAHRVRLFSTLMRASNPEDVWWSNLHHDGSQWNGWIIAGIDTPTGPVTYHLPVTEMPFLPEGTERERGKEWDGHTAADVLERLKTL